jgi:hypothetical protein
MRTVGRQALPGNLTLGPRRRVGVLQVAWLSVAAFIFSGCGAEGPPTLSEVRGFHAFHVYYVGAEIEGQELGSFGMGEIRNHPHSESWVFIYGHCDPPPTGEGGCPPPLQIHNDNVCSRWAGLFNQQLPLYDFRGAKARGGGGGIENSMEIFTGHTTVTIGTEEPKLAAAAARQLRDVREGRPTRLPPPAPGSLQGQLPCQRKPG